PSFALINDFLGSSLGENFLAVSNYRCKHSLPRSDFRELPEPHARFPRHWPARQGLVLCTSELPRRERCRRGVRRSSATVAWNSSRLVDTRLLDLRPTRVPL